MSSDTNKQTRPDLEDIRKTVKIALRDDDSALIAKAQLEVSAAMLHYLEAIDWKLWEIYSLKKPDTKK